MDETNQAKTGTPPAAGQSSDAREGSTSNQAPRTYTESEYQKGISDALAKQGREHKAALDVVSSERDNFKNTHGTLNAQIATLNGEIETAKKHVDELSASDPEKADWVKKVRELQAEQATLKTERQQLEADKQTNAERIKWAEDVNFEIACFDIAIEYEDLEPEKLKDICETAGVRSEDGIRKIAGRLGTKKAVEEPPKDEKPPLNADSGATSGGGEPTLADLEKMPMAEYAAYRRRKK